MSRNDPVEFLHKLQAALPSGVTLSEWEKPPDLLLVRSYVRYNGCAVPVELTFYELKIRTPSQQADYLKDKIHRAVELVHNMAENQCPIL